MTSNVNSQFAIKIRVQKWNETKLIKLIRNTHMTKLLPTYERAFLCGALTRKQIKVLMTGFKTGYTHVLIN